MNNLYNLIFLCCLLPGTTLLAQQQKDKNAPATEIKQLKNTLSDTTLNNTRQFITNKAKDETQRLKSSFKQKTETIKQDTLPKPDLKKNQKKERASSRKKPPTCNTIPKTRMTHPGKNNSSLKMTSKNWICPHRLKAE